LKQDHRERMNESWDDLFIAVDVLLNGSFAVDERDSRWDLIGNSPLVFSKPDPVYDRSVP
jgi:hypothetical protein